MKHWTEQEEVILRETIHLTDKQAAKIIGRSWQGVCHKRLKLGLTRGIYYRKSDPVYAKDFSDAELAYAAGIIDGEGCICLMRDTSKKNGRTKYTLSVQVVMTNKCVVEYLRHTFGGLIREDDGSKKGYSKVYYWGVRTRQVGILLKKILPFLRGKRKQAELAIEISDRLSGFTVAVGRKGYTQEFRDYLVAQHKIMSDMKKNGGV